MTIANIVSNIKANLSLAQKEVIGIQLSENFARLAFLSKNHNSFHIRTKPFEIEFKKEEAGQRIKGELLKKGIKTKTAAFSIPISSTLYKNLKLPKMSSKNLKEAVEWNIREEIQTLKGETVFDYAIISEEDNSYNILVVIAKKSNIDFIFDVAREAGIKPDIIDSEGIALFNLALQQHKKSGGSEEDKSICVINLDKQDSYLLFKQNNIILQTLDFNVNKYNKASLEEKETIITKLINELNYFFLTFTEPSKLFTSGYVVDFPEINSYLKSNFENKFEIEDINPLIALDIKEKCGNVCGHFSIPFSLAYEELSQ
jgi:type IV pilus assembly protein PilM